MLLTPDAPRFHEPSDTRASRSSEKPPEMYRHGVTLRHRSTASLE